jgi:type II secretory pathway component PulJ
MTISTPRTSPRFSHAGKLGSRSDHGFTLTEIIIAAGLSTMVLAGVLSAFLMIGRTSVSSSSYSQNEAETRRALERFGQDARLASNIHWANDHQITFTVAQPGDPIASVTYTYDGEPTSVTYHCLYRVVESNGSTSPRQILAREISELSFQRYKLEQTGVRENVAANDLETKQVQLTMRATRRSANTAIASQAAASACYILRNKRVSN